MLAYKIEYETTDITLDELVDKYNLEPSSVSSWKKKTKQEVVPATIVPTTTVVTADTILDDILEFKKNAIAHAKEFMANDVRFSEVKEFKDMVAVVTTLEASLKEQKQPIVNVLVQNLTERFKDDC